MVRATTLYGNGAGLTNISGILTTAEKTLATNSVQNGGAASVASLQVTGGATNGGSLIATNNLGQMGWDGPWAFSAKITTNQIFGNMGVTFYWDQVTSAGPAWVGKVCTLNGGNGYYHLIAHGSYVAQTGPICDPYIAVEIYANETLLNPGEYWKTIGGNATVQGDGQSIVCRYFTNGTPITVRSGSIVKTNYAAANQFWFEGWKAVPLP